MSGDVNFSQLSNWDANCAECRFNDQLNKCLVHGKCSINMNVKVRKKENHREKNN